MFNCMSCLPCPSLFGSNRPNAFEPTTGNTEASDQNQPLMRNPQNKEMTEAPTYSRARSAPIPVPPPNPVAEREGDSQELRERYNASTLRMYDRIVGARENQNS